MGLSHAEQRRRGVALSLDAAGIGRAYHTTSLAEVPGGVEIADWIKSRKARADVSAGRGLTFVGAGAPAYDLATLTARGLHLTGVASFVVPLRRLVKWLDVRGGTEALDAASQAEALFVLDFYQWYDKGECPLLGSQLQDVEVFLGDRLAGGRSVFLHSMKPLSQATWWSGSFLQRVARQNTVVEVKS
jgi:hypothetical protein